MSYGTAGGRGCREKFIAEIIRNKFDYTEWQREYFDAKALDEFHERAVEYARENPYKGSTERI